MPYRRTLPYRRGSTVYLLLENPNKFQICTWSRSNKDVTKKSEDELTNDFSCLKEKKNCLGTRIKRDKQAFR